LTPFALPFLLIKDVARAMRVSSAAGLVLIFISGFGLAKYSGLRPLLTASSYTAIGATLVVVTMMLGG